MELVSGWSDNDFVYLVERQGDDVRVKKMRAKWSAFFTGLDDKDRLTLQRAREVVGLSVSGRYTRVDFKDRWARKDIVWKIGQAMEGARAAGDMEAAVLEADVNPLRRFLSDHGTVSVSANPRCAWFDLETDSRCSFVDAVEHGKARILCWSLTTLVDGKAVRVAHGLLEADTDAAERRLLEDFFVAVRPYDVLLAWSGDGFDFPVLTKRADKVKARPGGQFPLWNRWCFLDCMEVFKKYGAHVHESGEEKTSFKLNSIAQAMIGEGKKDFSVVHTWEAWAAGGEERQRMLEYNLQDSDLMPKIEAKTGYVALHVAVCSVTRCFPDSRSLQASQQGDGFLLRLGEIHGHRWPTKKHAETVDPFDGAYVMEPTRTGIVESVHVADFASLYPSIMRSWNISPETVLWRLQQDPAEGSCRLPYTDTVRFSKAARGMFPRALDDLVARRAEYSRKADEAEPGSEEWDRYKRLSGAYKIVANSFYGIMGSPYARFFSSHAAEAVTQTGAWLIKRVAAASKDSGLDAFYGDSVTGDRIIVTKNPYGDVALVPIEELWDVAVGDGVTLTGKESGTLVGWSALARDAGGVDGWFPIVKVLRHVVAKPTWRLTTKHGQTEVTPDHGIMVDGRECCAEEFVGGELKFTALRAPREVVQDRIDLLRYVEHFRQTYEYKGRTIERYFASTEDGKSLVVVGWGDAEAGVRIQRFYERGSRQWESLLRLVAAYVSDGSSSIRGDGACRNLLSFCKADLEWQSRLADDLRVISNCTVFGPYWSDTVFVVRSGTLAMAGLFSALCGAGCLNKRFPSFVFELDATAFRVVYEALEKGDGSVDEAGQLAFVSTSQRLISGVSYLLSQHGVEHSFSFRESKGAWKLRTRPVGSERCRRYSIKAEVSEASPRAVYDLEVEGAHTFVDGVGRVLLHNTDSCFVSGESEKFSAVVRSLNEQWPVVTAEHGCVANHIKLEFEKSFKRIVLVSAKRYVGRFDVYKGKKVAGTKIEVKGLEYKRGDTIRWARAMQKELIDRLLADDVPAIEEIREFVAGWKAKVLEGELTVEDIVLSQSVKSLDEYAERYTSARCTAGKKKCTYAFASTDVTKDSPNKCPRCGAERKRAQPPVHVRVAKVLAERGEEIRAGTRVEYLIVSDDCSERLEAVPARDPGALEKINRHYYWGTRIYAPTARVLESAFPDESWTETAEQRKEGRKQAKIERSKTVDDLPLFSSARDPGGSCRLVITLDTDLDPVVDLEALKRLLLTKRGRRPVTLRYVGAAVSTTDLDLSKYPVDDSPEVISAIEKICGSGVVSLVAGAGN